MGYCLTNPRICLVFAAHWCRRSKSILVPVNSGCVLQSWRARLPSKYTLCIYIYTSYYCLVFWSQDIFCFLIICIWYHNVYAYTNVYIYIHYVIILYVLKFYVQIRIYGKRFKKQSWPKEDLCIFEGDVENHDPTQMALEFQRAASNPFFWWEFPPSPWDDCLQSLSESHMFIYFLASTSLLSQIILNHLKSS